MTNYPDREKDTQLRALQAATAALGWADGRVKLLCRNYTPLEDRPFPLALQDYMAARFVQDAMGDGIATRIDWCIAESDFIVRKEA